MDNKHARSLEGYDYHPTRRTNFVDLGIGDWVDFNRVVALFPYRPLWYRIFGLKGQRDPKVLNLTHGRPCRSVLLLDDGTFIRVTPLAPTLVVRSEGKSRPRQRGNVTFPENRANRKAKAE